MERRRRREGGGGARGENGMAETGSSQEVRGEDLQRGTHTVRSHRGQSVERKAHRERANTGALGNIQASSPTFFSPYRYHPTPFFMKGGGVHLLLL